ncbi:MAG: hypothetical protein OHK0057_30310 [Thermoflexibacter sp.]
MDITTQLYTSYIQSLTKDLLFISESEYPWQTLYLGEDKAQALKRLPFDVSQARSIEVEHLLRNHTKDESWYSAEELATAEKYRQFLTLLKEEVKNVSAYKFGEIEVHIYIIAQLPNGEWIAMKTISVET